MPGFRALLERFGRRSDQPEPAAGSTGPDGPPLPVPNPKNVARFEPMPEFATKLPVEAAGAPGRAGAEALYQKWAGKWQEF
jgi:hypothetical protein